MRFCTFASGSAGNSYYLEAAGTSVLLDCGIAGRRIHQGLQALGTSAEALSAICLTHEHIDHVQSIRMMARAAGSAQVFASPGTLAAVGDKVAAHQQRPLAAGESVQVGAIQIDAFALSHDAVEPTGFSFLAEGRRVTVITDTGYVTPEMNVLLAETDLAVLEANHEYNILMMGPYPYSLKQRIAGEKGHLSNEAAGGCLCQMVQNRQREGRVQVLLAHLSKENNTPEQALLTVQNILFEEDIVVGRDLELTVLRRDTEGPLIEF